MLQMILEGPITYSRKTKANHGNEDNLRPRVRVKLDQLVLALALLELRGGWRCLASSNSAVLDMVVGGRHLFRFLRRLCHAAFRGVWGKRDASGR